MSRNKWDGPNKIHGLLTANLRYTDIHPTMPTAIQDRLFALCNEHNVSFWDREKVYNQLHQMSAQLQNPPRD